MPARLSSETARLVGLDGYKILDTSPEQSFNDLREIAAAICNVSISFVSFVSGDRQWFKAEEGLGFREASRELSLCALALESKQTLIVPDIHQDPRFASHASVLGGPEIRFYACAPLLEANGHVLGTICVIDTEPRTLTKQQIAALEALARQAVMLLSRRTLVVENAEPASGTTRALQADMQSREQLRVAMDSAGLASWYFDPARNIVGGDGRMAQLFGLDIQEGSAEVWLAAIVEEDRTRVGEQFTASLTGAPYDTKFRVRVDGTLHWLHARAKNITNADGSVRMVGMCEDVSREELLAANLAKTAERLILAQHVSGATTFDWDVQQDIVSWGGEIFGRRPEELTSSVDFFSLLPESEQEPLRQVISAALLDGQEYYHEFQAHWPDGNLHWVSTVGKPLRNEQGKVISIVGANLDITDRRLSEEASLRSEKLAAVGRLASAISHEINNPLEAVTNLLYLVRNSPDLSQADQDHLEMADRELARVTHVTAQTLRFHRTPLDPTPINAVTVVNEILELYSTRLTASSITVEMKNSGDAAFTGFEGDIRQALNNLVGNSFDAMRRGGILKTRVRRGTEWKTSRRGTVITIADTGVGIGREATARIFEAFYSTKGIGGTGLGLWISHRIAHKHKGRLTFKSGTGQAHGTVFRFWLPREAASTASEAWAH
ncbi:MAG: PAS domain-containing protein [Janthinobacterium lividum]